MQSENRLFDDFVKMVNGVAGTFAGMGREAESSAREKFREWMAGNDFESPVFARHPGIRSAFEALVATHPVVCRMTGSGSSLLAIYRHAGEREDARMRLGRKHGSVVPVETLSALAAI